MSMFVLFRSFFFLTPIRSQSVLRTKLCSVPDNVIPFLRITVLGTPSSGSRAKGGGTV